MNPIGLVLDALLLGLLACALVLGLKLNGRLKALRAGQEGFAKAVAELDVAARRAEAGLADMRRAAEETHDGLQSRIETARGLLARLDGAALELSKRAPSVTGFGADSSPPRHERLRAVSSSVRGEVDQRTAETEGVRAARLHSRDLELDLDTPAPAGFADLIRRTLREPR